MGADWYPRFEMHTSAPKLCGPNERSIQASSGEKGLQPVTGESPPKKMMDRQQIKPIPAEAPCASRHLPMLLHCTKVSGEGCAVVKASHLI